MAQAILEEGEDGKAKGRRRSSTRYGEKKAAVRRESVGLVGGSSNSPTKESERAKVGDTNWSDI